MPGEILACVIILILCNMYGMLQGKCGFATHTGVGSLQIIHASFYMVTNLNSLLFDNYYHEQWHDFLDYKVLKP